MEGDGRVAGELPDTLARAVLAVTRWDLLASHLIIITLFFILILFLILNLCLCKMKSAIVSATRSFKKQKKLNLKLVKML